MFKHESVHIASPPKGGLDWGFPNVDGCDYDRGNPGKLIQPSTRSPRVVTSFGDCESQ